MSRPYEYRLMWRWCGECLSLDVRGFRTGEDGERQEFHNDVYDGKDPVSAVKVEQAIYKAFGGGTIRSKSPLASVEEIVMVLRGVQAEG